MPGECGRHIRARGWPHHARVRIEQHHQRRVCHRDRPVECVELGEEARGAILTIDRVDANAADAGIGGERGGERPIGDQHEVPVGVLEHRLCGPLGSAMVTIGTERHDARRGARRR